ncbi:CDP-glycerol glycerophosphotransferase family protein [bacterium]|nr:CDP-glycerol glycerophosphotransferase family protein [bacterium]
MISKRILKRVSKKIVTYVALFFPYFLSKLISRNEKIWVFGAWFGERYSDNSRYVFEFVCENEKNVRAIWISRNKNIVQNLRKSGKEAYFSKSFAAFWVCSRASLSFLTCAVKDVNIAAFDSKKIQLWHGTPLKKIGFDDKITENPNENFLFQTAKLLGKLIFPFSEDSWQMLISASPVVTQRFETAFATQKSKIQLTGFPRGDVILKKNPPKISIIEILKEKTKAKNVVFYVPTHRGEGNHSFDLFETLDFAKLEQVLEQSNSIFLIKMHFYHTKTNPTVSQSLRIHWCGETEIADINEVLPFVDLLITDYSSVYFDFLLLNRPIIFAPFDLERYQIIDRAFYENYEPPGISCKNWNEVAEAISEVLVEKKDKFILERTLAQKKYNTFVDTQNCKRVVEFAKKLLV